MAKEQTIPQQGIEPILEDVVEIAGYLWERGWAERSAGNLSMDVTDLVKSSREARLPVIEYTGFDFPELAQRAFLMPTAGCRMRDVVRQPGKNLGIFRITQDRAGYRLLWGDHKRFSLAPDCQTYVRIHQYLRAHHSEFGVVLHAHPESLIAMTQMVEFKDEFRLNSVLWGMHPETTLVAPNGVGLVHYSRADAEEVARATGAPLNTVRSRVRLGKEALRRRIETDAVLASALEVES